MNAGAPLAGAVAALYEAGRTIIGKGTQLAAHLLEVSAQDVIFADGVFSVPGTDLRLDVFAVAKAARDPAKLPAGMEPGLDMKHHRVPPAQTFPNGCHIAEVEIDPNTGGVVIERYTVVDDFGRTINPLLLEGQVHGGIVQGIGQALLEHAVYDPGSGQLLSGSFMDYTMPRAGDVPPFAFSTHNVPSTANPLGVKGAGEAGAVGAPPVVINAIVDALHRRVELRHIDMPATPLARVCKACARVPAGIANARARLRFFVATKNHAEIDGRRLTFFRRARGRRRASSIKSKAYRNALSFARW
jgi:carbon-monoxide dehydrogenase large subunit